MLDEGTGWYYNRARFYDPATGRFNKVDPYAGNMYDPLSLHKYIYCHADPVNGLDPTGMWNLPEINITTAIQAVLFAMNLHSGVLNIHKGARFALVAINCVRAGQPWDAIIYTAMAMLHFGMAALNLIAAGSCLNVPPPPVAPVAVAGATAGITPQVVWQLVSTDPQFCVWVFEYLGMALFGLAFFASSRDPHHADWELRDSSGRIITRGNEVSGADAPPGRVLDWQEQLFTHTERKILTKLFAKAKPGQIITIRGTKPPCQPGCIPAMQRYAKELGVKIMYEAEGRVWVFE